MSSLGNTVFLPGISENTEFPVHIVRTTLVLSVKNSTETKQDRVLKQALSCRIELVAYARALLGDYAAAEDVVQESMLVVVKKFDQFEEGTSIMAWCRSIVRLEVLRAKQQRQRERSLVEKLLDDAIDAAFEESRAMHVQENADSRRLALESCLGRLPKQVRRVLKSRFVDNLSYQKIAELVGMTLEAVRKSLYRSKKQVRGCVESKLRGAP